VAKFIAHVSVTLAMSIKADEEIILIEPVRSTGRALVKLGQHGMAVIIEALQKREQEYEGMQNKDDKDVQKLGYIKKYRELMTYCRQATLKD
jgi:hypothetical protein